MFSFRKLLGCILAPVGAFTIIGSGFSLWYFVDGDKPVAKESVDIGVNALDAVSKGNIDIIQSPHLVVLSQGSSNSENLFDGMVFYSNSKITIEDKTEAVVVVPDDTFTFRYTNATKFIPSETNNDLSDYGLKLNIAIYFELSDSVEDTSDYNIDRFLTIKSDVTNNQFCHQIDSYFPSTENNISKESKYFFLTDDSTYTNAIGFMKTTGTDEEADNSYIEYTVSLNQFFRYTSVDVKPDTPGKYKSLTEAIKKGGRDINIYVAAFYSDSVAIGG